jgi:hypothetical protein
MAALRIRNGLNLDALDAATRGRAVPGGRSVRVQTEWLGGMQALSRIPRGNADGPLPGREFHIDSDEPQEQLGNDSAPAALELALAALGASFTEAFVVLASAANVGIDALTVDVATSAGDSPAPKVHLNCAVESAASLAELREIGRRARAAAAVVQLYRPLPSVTVTRPTRLAEQGDDMP